MCTFNANLKLRYPFPCHALPCLTVSLKLRQKCSITNTALSKLLTRLKHHFSTFAPIRCIQDCVSAIIFNDLIMILILNFDFSQLTNDLQLSRPVGRDNRKSFAHVELDEQM